MRTPHPPKNPTQSFQCFLTSHVIGPAIRAMIGIAVALDCQAVIALTFDHEI